MEMLVRYLNPFCDCVYNHERVVCFLYHFEGRSGSKSIIDVVKIVWEIVGHACRPKGEKRRPKNVQGKKGAVVVVTTTGPAAALLYYFRDQLRYD